MSQLRHPNFVQFYGVHYKSDSVVPILIMECLPMSLTAYIKQTEKIPKLIKDSILCDVSQGLYYLHAKTPPIVHRDLTANNVLLTSEIKAKIADLGVSRIFEPEAATYYMRMSTCPGTLPYMPPEALKPDYKETSDNFDKLDVFSFGVLILHVYTQKWPKPGDLFDESNMPRTEIQRRMHLLVEMDSNIMRKLAEQCIDNKPNLRPHTSVLVSTVKKLVDSANKTLPGKRHQMLNLETARYKTTM